MHLFLMNRIARTFGLLASIALFSGCVHRDGDAARVGIVPGSTESRKALETSLAAWRDQESPKPELVTIGGLNFVDLTRLAGQKLDRYQILTEIEAPHARYLTARLQLTNPDETKVVRYLVFGAAPIWVYREEDFNMIMHWDHKMDDQAIAAETTLDRSSAGDAASLAPGSAERTTVDPKEREHEHHKKQ